MSIIQMKVRQNRNLPKQLTLPHWQKQNCRGQPNVVVRREQGSTRGEGCTSYCGSDGSGQTGKTLEHDEKQDRIEEAH